VNGLVLALALAVIALVVILPILAGSVFVAWIRARHGSIPAVVIGATLMLAFLASPCLQIGTAALYFGLPSARPTMVTIDLTMSRSARLEVVRLAATGELETAPWPGEFVLPARARGLSVHGTVDVVYDACGPILFFMTLTGFSPDPYAGFEYVPTGCDPILDPLGSGHGNATDLGDGWYWIEAR
jgi:hypothetical protein